MNYQKMLDNIIDGLNGERPRLLLHACCAPCSSYVLKALHEYFDITLFFSNSNITDREEFLKRLSELQRFVNEVGLNINVIADDYKPEEFFKLSRGLEDVPEGGERCRKCYRMRLSYTAKKAAAEGYDYFCTTLSISPYKNAEWINEIGADVGETAGVRFLPSDFKKKNGYKQSIELSKKYKLYRQNYCGCIFSKKQREERDRLEPKKEQG